MISSSSLILSGSSYLLPTLRIDRRENPESLSLKISQALQRGRNNNNNKKSGRKKWVVPIVLDLAAFAPDGSPHYIPPKLGITGEIIRTLREFGVVVVGFTNYSSTREGDDDLAGLPSLVSKGRVLDNPKFNVNLEDVIQMVLEKSSTEEERKKINNKSEEPSSTPSSSSSEEEEEEETNSIDTTTTSERLSFLTQTKDNNIPPEKIMTDDLPAIDSSNSSHDNNHSFVYYGSVRSGQQMMPPCKGQSLVIVGSVNPGGEVMSESDIYIFGKLKGRALAGLSSATTTTEAKIVATHFDPELICIGETFTTVDDVVKDFDLKQSDQAAIVTLSDGQLVVKEMNL